MINFNISDLKAVTFKPSKLKIVPTVPVNIPVSSTETFHRRQIQKLYKVLSPHNDLKLNLLLSTLPNLRTSGVDLDKLAASSR